MGNLLRNIAIAIMRDIVTRKLTVPMNHVILLGDSIFDNRAYVEPGPDVITQLRQTLEQQVAEKWHATLLAVDGSVINDISEQLKQLPEDATHLVVSVGGNNALREASLLMNDPPDGAIATLRQFTEMKALFHRHYRQMLQAILAARIPTILCTIYDQCPTKDPYLGQLMYVALPMFNDCISREAIQAGFPLLDLRLVCSNPEDYAEDSPIEPSVKGGQKIATQIAHILVNHNFQPPQTVVYGGSSS